jgi:hypothetical protein
MSNFYSLIAALFAAFPLAFALANQAAMTVAL